MSTTLSCSVCGSPARAAFRAPPPELAPDLDLRPGEPTRSTLSRWVQTCRTCLASAPDLTVLTADLRPVVETAEFRAITASEPALGFLRWAALCRDPASRGEALLQAAWAADDVGDAEGAVSRRLAAAAAWAQPAEIEQGLRRLDVLRRAGAFAAAAAWAERLAADVLDENSARIVAFQAARIAERDTSRHLLSSALRPPAHRPHVAHQPRPVKRGLWRVLTGR